MGSCVVKVLACFYLIASVVRLSMLWGDFKCQKPVQAWLLAHQLISLLLCLGYELAHHMARSQDGELASQAGLLPLSGSRLQKVVSLCVLFLIIPAFLASDCLGLFWIMSYSNDSDDSSSSDACWPIDSVNQPQVIRLELGIDAFIGIFFVMFATRLLCSRMCPGRARAASSLAAARRAQGRVPLASPGANVPVHILLSHCPEAQCDKDCNVHCSICQDPCQEGQQMRTVVVCGHQYHGECLETWLRNRPTCPNCNQDVTTPVV